MDMLSDKLDRNLRLNDPEGEIVRAGLGGAAVKELLQEIDLEKLAVGPAGGDRHDAGAAPGARHQAAGSRRSVYQLQVPP